MLSPVNWTEDEKLKYNLIHVKSLVLPTSSMIFLSQSNCNKQKKEWAFLKQHGWISLNDFKLPDIESNANKS